MNPCGLSRTEETWSRLDEPIDAEFERRRAELDQELKAMGAHVIHVRDLGAALEAREWSFAGLQAMTFMGQSVPFPAEGRLFIRRAVGRARQALGESS